MHNQTIVELNSVSRAYIVGRQKVYALKDINLRINRGEFITIIGKSGSGKSTLLNLLACIDRATEGSIKVNGRDIYSLDKTSINKWRGNNLGIVFQFFQLLPTLTVFENVLLPMELVGAIPWKQRKSRAISLLEKVGLDNHINKYPFELSGGEQQRCAIARALSNNAPIIIADEPTGNLDSLTGRKIFKLLGDLKKDDKTIIMVTHEKEGNSYSDRTIELLDGQMVLGNKEEVS